MNLKKVTIQNFGCHKNSVIEIPDGITAVIGQNGSGKSFFLESIPAVQYGEFPSRPGNIIDNMTLGYIGDGLISIEVEKNGVDYLLERKTRKTAKTELSDAVLTDLTNNKQVAGPKITEFEQEVKNLFGDPRLFFASSFMSQGNKGDLVECKITERKEILAELLGLERFKDKSEHFNEKYKVINIKLEEFEQKKDLINSSIEVIDINMKKLIESEKALHEKELKDIVAEVDSLKDKLGDLLKQEEDNSKIQSQIKDKEFRALSIDREITSLTFLISNIDSLKKEQKDRETLIQENELLVKENQVIQKMKDNNNRFINEWNDKNNVIIFTNNKIHLEIGELKGDIEQIRSAKALKVSKFKQLKESLEHESNRLVPGKYTATECQSCDFIKSAFKAKEELSKLSEMDFPEYDTQAEILFNKIEELKCKIEDTYEKPKLELVPDIKQLNTIPADKTSEIIKAEKASSDIESNKSKIELLNKEILDLKGTVAVVDISVRDSLENLFKDQNSKCDRLALLIKEKEKEIATIDEKVRKNKEFEEKIKNLDKENEQNQKDKKIYFYLKKAFGKNGIQALLIDSAIPQIQSISDELIQIATEGRMSIIFSTERKLKSGQTREGFEIICSDEKGERDVKDFSGGEQKLLKIIIRLTIAIFQALSSNVKSDILFIDEAFDALDAENAERMLFVLHSLKQYFKKVIFVSHNEELLTDFPQKIILKKEGGYTVVS